MHLDLAREPDAQRHDLHTDHSSSATFGPGAASTAISVARAIIGRLRGREGSRSSDRRMPGADDQSVPTHLCGGATGSGL
jgi:hypothetical protein